MTRLGHGRPLTALLQFPAPVRDRVSDRHPEPQTGLPATPSSTPRFAPIRDLLPRIGLTTRTLRKLEAIQLVREQREQHNQRVAFSARPFVLCGLPLRCPPKDHLVYTRRNGVFLLEITAHPRFGLPYGQDRLIPIWLATLAHDQKSRTVEFRSPSQLLDYFRLPKNGAQYRRIRAAFQRVFAATILFGTEEEFRKHIVVDSSRFHFMDSVQLWFKRSSAQEISSVEAALNTVTLSEVFYQEIAAHPIPVEREVIAALAHAPGLLDFYVWVAWKSWTVNGPPARVPILGPNGLAHQLGTAQYSVERLFRHKIKRWLAQVKLLWPECPAEVSEEGRFLVVSSSRRSAAVRSIGGVMPG